jgi:uncharacterized membrane protein YdjX (TVP38/TMEM64 family)
MKDLLRIAVLLALAFGATFFLVEQSGVIDEARIRRALHWLQERHPVWVMAAVVLLLLLDLFVAIPTMVTILLAGYLLGALVGGITAAVGLMALGLTGYVIGRRGGRTALLRLYKDDQRLAEIDAAFARNDMLLLFVCQALPILPELSACLAGASRMRLARFLLGYGVGVVPFAFIVATAGAASSEDNLSPAIYTAIGVSVTLLLVWTLLKRRGDPQRG